MLECTQGYMTEVQKFILVGSNLAIGEQFSLGIYSINIDRRSKIYFQFVLAYIREKRSRRLAYRRQALYVPILYSQVINVHELCPTF